ncbi:permease [Microbulbifer thermotolerans]|uniref:permease n=1 Tax=Microbulbifer thermotolerans TaxID=252514 RepID=UPI00224B67FD|nr:permease [Microbulbifer thermotolerans]MCX2781956.1 permease [Microbulbifer thermotolerans]
MTDKCCGPRPPEGGQVVEAHTSACCADEPRGHLDWLLWISLSVVAILYCIYWVVDLNAMPEWLHHMSAGVVELVHTMWWGVVAGALFVGLLGRIPQELVIKALGRGGSKRGLFRATLAGLFFDLCSHGILMVGMQLYKRGASIGQVMAFLIASPWNSLSLTVILIALIGFWWTLLFILCSAAIALISGYLADRLVEQGKLPPNPNKVELPEDYDWRTEVVGLWQRAELTPTSIGSLLWEGIRGSQMVVRWLLVGIVLAVLVRAFVDPAVFQQWFGPSALGLAATLVAATILEVCSEGATPLAADIFSRATAPGNAFAFLMAGVSTDYTELMSIKDTTGSWKIGFALPLLTLPQIILVGLLMNGFGA